MKNVILEEHGYFWWHNEPIPEGHFAPESAVTGNLKIDEEGRIKVELHGMLPGEQESFSRLFSQHVEQDKFIQGILKDSGRHVLLMRLLPDGGRISTNGISYEGFLANSCLIGSEAIKPGRAMKFRKLEIPLKGYEEWLRLGSIKVERSSSTISAKYKKPKDISYRLDDGIIKVKYDCFSPFSGKSRDLTLNESAALVYSYSKNIDLEAIKIQFGSIEDLLILLTDSEYCLDWPSISSGKKSYKFYFLRNKSAASAPSQGDCWTNFVQLREKFGEIFSEWKRKRDFFGPGFYLYLGTRRGMRLYTEHRFVNLIWGIESFHRRKYPDRPQSPRLVKKIERILGQISATKDRAWLSNRLEFAAEPNLEQRIFETFNSLPLNLNSELLRKFSAACAKFRHDISHFGGQREKGDYTQFVIRLDKISDSLSFLYHALLLYEIGIDAKIINWWIYDGYKSGWIKKNFIEVGLIDK